MKLKLATFQFQKYGTLDGTVIHVGPDASEGAGAATVQSNGIKRQGEGAIPGYRAYIDLKDSAIGYEGQRLFLASGMQVVAEIRLGERTVLEYVLSPVRKAFLEAGRER